MGKIIFTIFLTVLTNSYFSYGYPQYTQQIVNPQNNCNTQCGGTTTLPCTNNSPCVTTTPCVNSCTNVTPCANTTPCVKPPTCVTTTPCVNSCTNVTPCPITPQCTTNVPCANVNACVTSPPCVTTCPNVTPCPTTPPCKAIPAPACNATCTTRPNCNTDCNKITPIITCTTTSQGTNCVTNTNSTQVSDAKIEINLTNIINNNNTVHNPVNVNSHNENNINLLDLIKKLDTIQIEPTINPVIKIVSEKPENCCSIISPKVCKENVSGWNCYHNRYRKCGNVCTQRTIRLRQNVIRYRRPILVMPPLQTTRRKPRYNYINCNNGICSNADCSGCINGYGYGCSNQCYDYEEDNADYLDHNEYCENNQNDYGCSFDDGYMR